MSVYESEARTSDVGHGDECHWCRREAPCECMTLVRDGGPLYERITGTWGWSNYPERCMCSCGRCQAPYDDSGAGGA